MSHPKPNSDMRKWPWKGYHKAALQAQGMFTHWPGGHTRLQEGFLEGHLLSTLSGEDLQVRCIQQILLFLGSGGSHL